MDDILEILTRISLQGVGKSGYLFLDMLFLFVLFHGLETISGVLLKSYFILKYLNFKGKSDLGNLGNLHA